MSIDQSSTTPHDAARESTIGLGQRLRQIRLSRNLTQADVAKDLFSISYVSGVERGQIRPSLGGLERLAERLDVPLVDLMTEDNFSTHSSSAARIPQDTAKERHRQEAEGALREAHILFYQRRSEEAVTRLLSLVRAHLIPRQTTMLQLLLATCYNQQGRAEEARQVAQEALPEAEKAGERDLAVRLRCELGRACSLLLDHASALEQYQLAEQALQDEPVRNPAVQLSVLLHLGSEYHSLGEHEHAIATLTEAGEVAKDLVRPQLLGGRYWMLSQAIAAAGDPMRAQGYSARSLAAYEEAARRRA